MKIFFAGPLTNLPDPEKTKLFYTNLGALARKYSHEPFWAFLAGTDPIKNPEVTPAEVYKRDTEQLTKSDLMIAYVGEASTGTGDEIEYANARNIPVIIMYEKGNKMSRMILGNPAVKKSIVFETEDQALKELEAYFVSVSPKAPPLAS